MLDSEMETTLISRKLIHQMEYAPAIWYFGFCLLCFTNYCGDIAFVEPIRFVWETLRDVLGIVALSCFLLKLLTQSYTYKSLVIVGLFAVVGLIIRLETGDSTILFLALIASSSDRVKLETALKISAYNAISVLAICALFSFLSLTNNADIIDSRAVFGIRFAFGFVHPNAVGKLLVSFIASYVLLSKERGAIGIAINLLAFIVSYFFANSRTASIAILGLFVIYLTNKSRLFLSVKWDYVINSITSLSFGGVVFLMIVYTPENGFLNVLNAVLSYRPEFWHSFYEIYGLSLFGNRLCEGAVLNMNGLGAQLDGSYAVALIQYGIIASAFLIMLFRRFVKRAGRSAGSSLLFAVLAVFLLVGLVESYAFSPFYNVSLVAIGCCLREGSSEIGSRHISCQPDNGFDEVDKAR